MKRYAALVLTVVGIAAWVTPTLANDARQAILDGLAAAAGGAGFSADAGKALFLGSHSGGNPDTPSCSTCHTNDPRNQG